ncbi:c-type cytochrome domain-containing protein [Thiogranum longum]
MNDRITTFLLTPVIAAGLAGCSKSVTYADVEPVLQERCAECHTGDQEGVVASGFSVDSYETVMKGTKLGPVIVAGSSASSTLYRMVAGKTDPEIHMPHGKNPLSNEQVETIKVWIDQGAVK